MSDGTDGGICMAQLVKCLMVSHGVTDGMPEHMSYIRSDGTAIRMSHGIAGALCDGMTERSMVVYG